MDFTATVKRRRFGCSASDRSPYEMPPEALLQSARSSRSEAGAKALDPRGTGLGHSATRRRVKATGVVCRGRRLSSASVRSCSGATCARR
jgi:hypothetical protein